MRVILHRGGKTFDVTALAAAAFDESQALAKAKEERAKARTRFEAAKRGTKEWNEAEEDLNFWQGKVANLQAKEGRGSSDAAAGQELIGKRIRFKVPGPNGQMTVVGTVKEGVRPNELEVKSNTGGYYKLSSIGQYEVLS